jgi:hypothetical protein
MEYCFYFEITHKATELEDTYFTHAGPKNFVSVEALAEFFIPFQCIVSKRQWTNIVYIQWVPQIGMLKYKGVLRRSATNGKKNVNFSAARVHITIYKNNNH